jgi:hypothetical protein
MRPRWSVRRIWLLVAVFLSGCIDLVPVAPPLGKPAVLNIFLRLTDPVPGESAAVPVLVSAILEPGVDDIGRSRSVADDRLIISGESLDPVERGGVGRLVYSATIPIERDLLLTGSFVARPPAVEGLIGADLEIHWPVALRLEPGPLTVRAGSELILRVGLTGEPGLPVPNARRWSVSAFGPEGWLSRGGDGLPPSEIAVQSDLLGGPEAELLAIVNLSQTTEVAVDGGDYLTRLELSQELRWDVTISE